MDAVLQKENIKPIASTEMKGVKIVRIISESKHIKGEAPRRGYRRVMAVVSIHGKLYTRHCDTKDGVFALMRGYQRTAKV